LGLRLLFPSLLIHSRGVSEIRLTSVWIDPPGSCRSSRFSCSDRCDDTSPTQEAIRGIQEHLLEDDGGSRDGLRNHERQARIEIERQLALIQES
ncbi:hypothetical protein Tco_0289062, partial [Tanacetum coccineum]